MPTDRLTSNGFDSAQLAAPLTTGLTAQSVAVGSQSDLDLSSYYPNSSSFAALDTYASPAAAPVLARPQADFNGDGQSDILLRDYTTGQNAVWLMNGTTLNSISAIAPVSDPRWRIEGTGDFNSDAKTDILWRNYSSGENIVWLMNGTSLSQFLYLQSVQDTNWLIQGAGDFTGDGKTDIVWRHRVSGQNVVWQMNDTTMTSIVFLPTVQGSNIKIQAIGDFNQDGNTDIVWRNTLSGENSVWLMNGTTVSRSSSLQTVNDSNWQITGAGDYNADGKTDILWHNIASDRTLVWVMDDLTFNRLEWIDSSSQAPNQSRPIPRQSAASTANLAANLVTLSDFSFSGKEGDTGTFKLQLNQAPTSNVNLTFSSGSSITVDADGVIANGTQTTITFTPQDWNQRRTVWFVAEQDGSSADRLTGNTISYSLSGGLTSSETYDLGTVSNTYAPDSAHFNIDLDFRNDYQGFWTTQRRAVAQRAADDWAVQIANEWTDFKLNNTLQRLDNDQARTASFGSQRYVDDVVVFINPFQGSIDEEPALSGPDYEFGGWNTAAGPMPRVGQLALNAAALANRSDWLLYQVVVHELGHSLGLLGLNWTGYNLEDRSSPQTATFRGEYSRAANGGTYIPLQSQDGGDYAHPGNQVRSVMSYGWTYNLYGPTQIDFAMLADSGYRVYGVNA